MGSSCLITHSMPSACSFIVSSFFASLFIVSCSDSTLLVDNSGDERGSQSLTHALVHPLEPGYGNNIPAAPVQWQANSCSLDLSNQLLGGVKLACMMGVMDRARCCPVLAAWLMAARSKFALQPPISQQPQMPLLPDDSLVCIATMTAALQSRGIYLTPPNNTCDVISCFCGIKLNEISISSCPLSFSDQFNSSFSHQSLPSPSTAENPVSSIIHTLPSSQSDDNLPEVPYEPSNNATSIAPASAPLQQRTANGSSLLQKLEANCMDHSYRGCTKCLTTLQKEVWSESARRLGITNSSIEIKHCELIGLIWLLDTNKTFYIPTVSAVLRALMFDDHPTKAAKCSPDTANMPLALDNSEIMLSSHGHIFIVSPIRTCCAILITLLSHALVFSA